MINYISLIQPYIDQGLVLTQTLGDLAIYNYSTKCTYDKCWDDITSICRGLIVNTKTNEVVAKPFPKFFNLGENESTQLYNLPLNNSYKVWDKMDGSLGIAFRYNDKFRIATRGAFESEQAIWATDYLNKNFDLSGLPDEITLLFEIIYPKKKIIIDYKGREDLVLLGAYNRFTLEEYSWDEVKNFANEFKFNLVELFGLSIQSCIELQKTLPKEREGFVVRFDNGIRVKIKGSEYLKFSKMLSVLGPIALWEVMRQGKVSEMYLAEIPEEHRDEANKIAESLENKHEKMLLDIKNIYDQYKHIEIQKDFAIEVISKNKSISNELFALRMGKMDLVDKEIMKKIRPDGNVL